MARPLFTPGLKTYFLTLTAFIMGCMAAEGAVTGNSSESAVFALQGKNPDSDHPPGVVINEIMADPTPVVGLPDAEWVELFNCGETPLSLKGWELTVGIYRRSLPDTILHPGQYRVICSQGDAASLSRFSELVVLPSFPALKNSGNRITLSTPDGSVADLIDYSDKWYGDAVKKNGGWSLERIDPERHCGQKANWSASIDPSGGTPGKINSVKAINHDNTRPVVAAITMLSDRSAVIIFSETMDTLKLKEISPHHFPQEWGTLRIRSDDEGGSLFLEWDNPLIPNQIYQVNLSWMTDECGNLLEGGVVELSWVMVYPGDVVINEVLFNPFSGGADFVEILNISEKTIPAGKLILASRDASGELKKPVSLKGTGFTLAPGDHLAITTHTEGVVPFYSSASRERVRQIAALPPMYNASGCVVLLTDSMTLLDEMNYDEKMHHPLLTAVKGVSLERTNPLIPASRRENWHSAAETAGFATPGSHNSTGDQLNNQSPLVSFEQTAFSPNHDGYNDELIINCNSNDPGWMARISIFDTSGRLVYPLARNLLLGTRNEIRWNGTDKTGSKFPTAPYIVLVELFHPDGRTHHQKEAVFLTNSSIH